MKYTTNTSKLIAVVFLISCTYFPQSFAAPSSGEALGWYFGGGITKANLTFNDKNLANLYSTNTTDATFSQGGSAFKLFAGFQFDPLLAVELGYTSFGEIVMNNPQGKSNLFKADGTYISATATQPISKNIDVLAKGGMFFWSLYEDVDNIIEDGQGLTYGAGVNINLYGDKKRTLLIEWEHYSFSGVALEEADTLGASIQFRF